MGMMFHTGIEMNARAFALDGTSVAPPDWTSKSWGRWNEFRPVNGAPGSVVVEYTHQNVNGTNYGYVLVPDNDFPELAEFLTRYTLLSSDYDAENWPPADAANIPYFDPVTGQRKLCRFYEIELYSAVVAFAVLRARRVRLRTQRASPSWRQSDY